MNNDDGENFSLLSLLDRIEHKSWRARLSAFEQIGKECATCDGPQSAIFKDYMDYMRRAPAEPNAAALDAALVALFSYSSNAPSELIIR